MFYNRILRTWVIDPVDCLILSAIIGSLIASEVKNYRSEKRAMEREKKSMEKLKNSIIQKSKPIDKVNKPILASKTRKIKKIYKFTLDTHGGQFEEFEAAEISKETFALAQKIQQLIERLAKFLKERELQGTATILFKGGRIILQLILRQCKINMTYVLPDELSTQVIVITATLGSATGFVLSWFPVGAILVSPAALISALFLRSVSQQVQNQQDFLKFKAMLTRLSKDPDVKEGLQEVFWRPEQPTQSPLEMGPEDPPTQPSLKMEPVDPQQIKARMEEEYGLIENPSDQQLEKIIEDAKIKNEEANEVKNLLEELADLGEAEEVEVEFFDSKEPMPMQEKPIQDKER